MQLHKFSSTDAFIAFDLDDAPATGITRVARKVLRDGAVLLARDTTYAFASFGVQRGGGSAGINAEGDARDDAVAAFVAEAAELVSTGRWTTDPGLGVTAADLADLYAVDPRPEALWSDGLAEQLTSQGAVAAADAALGGLSGASAAVVGTGAIPDAARAALADAGASVVGDTLDAAADVVFVAGKTGVVDHDAAATISARVIVPLTPVPLTTRAHAEVTKAERIHVPSFLSTAAPLLAGADADGGDPLDRVRQSTADLAGADLWMAAARRAEEFLATWNPEVPTFRPLA